ncbi:MAG: Ig-like domain-containing protein, partial [Pseudomonadota bacterium]
PDLGALGGKNDFVMWQGGDQSDAPGEAVLTYYIVIDTPGLYEFRMRDQPGTDRPEVGGDTWVKIDGARFYGANGDSIVYPDGADPSDYPSDAQMLSEADGQDGFMRYQSTNRSTHWGSGGYVNDTGDRDDRHDIVVEFDAPGVYAVHFSGATPSSHAMGSFGLFNPDLTDGVDLQGAESARREVVLDEAPTPPEAPGTAPDAVDDSFEVMAEAGRVRLNVLANDSDAETHSLTIVSVGDAGKGSVEIVGKRVVYTADEGASGSDSFTYTIEDKDGRQSSATVSVEIDDSAQATGRLELGHTAFEQRRADEWHSVTFDKAIKDAVVVLGPVTFNGAQASVAELRNVTDTGFEMRIAEWAGSGYHKVEEISWMAASAGTHQLADGTLVQAGMTSAVDEVPANVSFAESFGGATDPIVFAQVASDKGGQTVTTRIDAVDEDGFSVQMQEAEAADGQHMREDIGWIALEGDSTAFDHLGTMSLDDNWTKLHSGPGKPTDVMLADMQTFNGTDTATLRYQDRANGVAMVVQEEVTLDAETNHAVETVGYLLGNSGSYDLYS